MSSLDKDFFAFGYFRALLDKAAVLSVDEVSFSSMANSDSSGKSEEYSSLTSAIISFNLFASSSLTVLSSILF